jgi:fatty acid desaturase
MRLTKRSAHTPEGTPDFDLTPEQIEAFGAELQALERRVRAELGEKDARYIRDVMRLANRLDRSGRLLLLAGLFPPAWLAGTAMLAVARTLHVMEIGHNVMHGQYDFMNDPAINTNYEWDTSAPNEQWRHGHNYVHHTYTNVLGVDHDVGYRIARLSEDQPWHPKWLLNLPNTFLLATLFEYGVALHDSNAADALLEWDIRKVDFDKLREMAPKFARLALRDFMLYPLLAGPAALPVLTGNITAGVLRNWWNWAVIYCGHFPEGTALFTQEQIQNETRGQWYLRQLLGSANIEGSKLMHLLSGHLSHQIEHHLFPTIPAWRYPEMAKEVRRIADKYGVPYTTGPFARQVGNVIQRIARLSFPVSLDDARHWRKNAKAMARTKADGLEVLAGKPVRGTQASSRNALRSLDLRGRAEQVAHA